MATLSATASAAQASVSPLLVHEGMVTKYSEYVVTASLSVGDTIHMLKIPVGVRVTDLSVEANNPAAGTLCFDVGDANSATRYLDSATIGLNTVRRMDSGLGYRYSAASSTTFENINLVVTEATSSTTSLTLKLAVTYQKD